MTQLPILFVYGTLKREGPLHPHLENSEFLGEAVTLPCYTLWDLGAYPGLAPGGSTAVQGELYRVAEDLWNHLDDIEGAPDLFLRRPVRLASEPFEAQAYFLASPPSFGKTISAGVYELFHLAGH